MARKGARANSRPNLCGDTVLPALSPRWRCARRMMQCPRTRSSKPPPGSVNSPICRSLCPAIYQGPIAGPRKALGERTRVVVEHGSEQGPARADALDLAGRVPSHARALSADRVGGEPVPERQRHLLERQVAWSLRGGVDQLLQTDAELLPPRARRCGIEPRAPKTLGLCRCDLLASGVQALCQRRCALERRDLEPQPARPGLIQYLAGLLG